MHLLTLSQKIKMPILRAHENDILDTSDGVFGLIYLITCLNNNKKYVGQTRSHYKNRGKFRPYGIQFRFKCHMNKAVRNTSIKQCTYLYNAMRKHGTENFRIEELEICTVEDADDREKYWIKELNTLFPNGYNLTPGGKTVQYVPMSNNAPFNCPVKRGGCQFRSEETRAKMSKRAQELINDQYCAVRSRTAMNQHYNSRLSLFAGCDVSLEDMETYIRTKGKIVVVTIQGKTTQFTSKTETLEQSKERARTFIRDIHNATLSNCGKPVKHEVLSSCGNTMDGSREILEVQ